MLRASTWIALGCLLGAPAASVEAQTPTGAPASAARPAPALLAGTSADVLTTIQGNALNSANAPIAGSIVRLRDARRGGIVGTSTTDQDGVFVFPTLDPGSYVAELLSEDGRVLASSPLLNVEAGEVVSTIVKLPFEKPPLGGLLGHSAASALAVTTAAATSGVLATAVAGEPVSP